MNSRSAAAFGERTYKSRGPSSCCHQNTSEIVGLVPFNTDPVVSSLNFAEIQQGDNGSDRREVNQGGGYGLEVSCGSDVFMKTIIDRQRSS